MLACQRIVFMMRLLPFTKSKYSAPTLQAFSEIVQVDRFVYE